LIDSPYPRSKVIKGIKWLTDNQRYVASHGDVWSNTWADDDMMYCVADDTFGINKSNNSNLAVYKVTGQAPGHQIELVNPMHMYGPLGYYDGYASWKATGMVSVDGVLYMGVSQQSSAYQYVDNVQRAFDGSIIKSNDHGVRWSTKPVPGHAMFPCLGFPTPFFVEFGKDYQDAIDDYVYAVSNDGTWNNGNFMTLRRCPRKKIVNLVGADWEVFKGLDAAGAPTFEPINPIYAGFKTPAIFQHRGYTSMTGMHYVPFLKRFILPQWAFVNLDQEANTAFSHSALMLYEAPNMWGPWSLFHVEPTWNKGSYNPSLPSKWFEDGGRAMWIVGAGEFYNHEVPGNEYCFGCRKFELLV